MFARIQRTVVSFIVVFALFWVYRLIAAPLIEPRIDEKRVASSADQDDSLTAPQNADRLGGYARFFPDDAWERSNPIALESQTAKLLTKDYKNLTDPRTGAPDGRVQLKPCTVIFFPDGNAEAADSHKRVIILQAPEATLQFDGPLDLSRGKIGRLLGGVLEGEVTVRSEATRPQGGDDIYAVTHDMLLVGSRIITAAPDETGHYDFAPNDVQFRFGQSTGHGRGMQIDLTTATATTDKPRGFNFSGVQDLQLLQDVEMHLQRPPPDAESSARGGQDSAARRGRLPGFRPRRDPWGLSPAAMPQSISAAKDRSISTLSKTLRDSGIKSTCCGRIPTAQATKSIAKYCRSSLCRGKRVGRRMARLWQTPDRQAPHGRPLVRLAA